MPTNIRAVKTVKSLITSDIKNCKSTPESAK